MFHRLSPSADFIAKRLLTGLISIWGAVTVVFFMLLATGNPALTLAGDDASAELIGAIAQSHGLDRAWWKQYVDFLFNLLTGNFPLSLWMRESALDVVLRRVPRTLLLTGSGLALGAATGLAIGYLAATSRSRLLREWPIRSLLVLNSAPSFVLALALIMLFSLQLRWLPTSGATSWRHFILPIVTFALLIAPDVARMYRASIIELGREDHVLTALAKGLTHRQVRLRHVAMNALVPVVSLLGMRLGSIVGGSVVVETVFAWPGVGQLLLESVQVRDYPVVLTAVLLMALGYVLATLVTDVLLTVLSPRTRN